MKLRSVARRAVRALVCCLVWVMACLVFAGPASSAGVIYKYEDEQGMTHYTDRRELIPEKLRSKAKVIDSGKAPVTVVPTPPSPPPAPGEQPRPRGSIKSRNSPPQAWASPLQECSCS